MDVVSESRLPQDFACLAIETATPTGTVAVCAGGRIVERELNSGLQSRQIYSAVNEVLSDLDIGLDALDCLALGAGPGAFTGLRVAAAAVQALAYGSAKPVVRLSSLEVLALRALQLQAGSSEIVACLDARMGEIYVGHYRQAKQGYISAVLSDRLVDPATLELPADLQFYAAGSGWSAHEALAQRYVAQIKGIDGELVPAASTMLQLAARDLDAGHAVSAQEALPNYVRDKVTY